MPPSIDFLKSIAGIYPKPRPVESGSMDQDTLKSLLKYVVEQKREFQNGFVKCKWWQRKKRLALRSGAIALSLIECQIKGLIER